MEEFKKRFDVDELPESNSYQEYAKKLSQFDYVISTRLHTNVITLSTNTRSYQLKHLVLKQRNS
jgi:polysaccharide pyruvyl transferase WcaK-like protein